MSTIIKNEFHKVFKYKGIYIAFILGLLLVIADSLYYYNEVYSYTMSFSENDLGGKTEGMWYPPVLMQGWIGHNISSVYSEIYYTIFPFIAVLPFGVTYYEELKTGYLKNIVTRVKRSKYILAKYIVTFVSGGMVCAFPSLLSAWIAALYLPNMPMNIASMSTLIGNTHFMWEIFRDSPATYILIYSLLAFIFGGLMATLAMGIAHLSDNRFFVYVYPFLLQLSIDYLFKNTKLMSYSPANVIVPWQPSQIETKNVVITLLVIALFSVLTVLPHSRKKDLV